MTVRESPEIAAVMVRIGQAWGARDFETYSNLISSAAHFRGIGTDLDEFWDDSERFLAVRRVQLAELDEQGWDQAEATVERLDAFEDGPVGWASMLYALKTPIGDVSLRATAVLSLEAGAWKVVQWHASVPSANVQTFGVELTTSLEDLLTSVAEDTDALEALDRTEGTVTLVITDIVDSTVHTEQMGDEAWIDLLKSHESDIRLVTERRGGAVVKMTGDGSMLTFNSSRSAVQAALDIMETTRDSDFAIRVGIHAGEVVRTEGDVFGIAVNKAVRVASVAQGDQVLASAVVAELASGSEGFQFGEPETVTLKGLSGTHVVRIVHHA